MSWAKSDGAKIRIAFNLPLVGDLSGQQSFFSVTVPEYNFVPEGTLGNVSKTVLSTYGYEGLQKDIDLSMSTKDGVVVSSGVITLEVAT